MNADVLIPSPITAVLTNPAAYADGRIHEAYNWLRLHNPLGLAASDEFDPFWVVTKHADIAQISREAAQFSCKLGPNILMSKATQSRLAKITGGATRTLNTLNTMDAPEHPKYRSISHAWFMPANLAKIEQQVRRIARDSVDAMLERGDPCDFAKDVAVYYPLRVIMHILGVPIEDEPRMLMLTQQIFGGEDPDMARSDADFSDPAHWAEQLKAACDEFGEYFSRITADRRQNPRDDLATVIANARVDGLPIPDNEMLGYYVIVATAGHDTTSASTAGAVLALCENPSEFAKVKADRGLIPQLVEEAIRWTTPVKHFLRTATAPTVIRDRSIAAGDHLMLCYASANRDEEVFAQPFEFRSDRKPNNHIAFGYGSHFCLGQYLAKLEMRAFFEEFLPRIGSIELAGSPTWAQSKFISGLKSLPIRFTRT
jgi:cytochrome P450